VAEAAEQQQDEQQDMQLVVDGTTVDTEDFTFREKREVRKVLRELMDDPEADVSEALMDDLWMAMILVAKRRTEPEFSVDDAMDLKLKDFLKPVEPDPPTGAARRKK
jgi:hypothetical protein